MPRNLNQFSEFQLGFIQAIADAVHGTPDVVFTDDMAVVAIRNRNGLVFFQWRQGETPKLWNGLCYVPMTSTLAEFLYSLENPGDEIRRITDALNDLLNRGAFDNLSDSADAIAKFYDSLGDATVDGEDEDEDEQW